MSPSAPRETSFSVFLRALASLLAALGLLFGVPVALVLFVGWPLPTEVPTWASFTESLEQQGVTYEALINGLAVIVWLAWVPLAWAILVEAVAAVRGRAASRVHAWPGAQYVARKLVASAALLLSSLGGVRAAGAEPLDPLVVMNAEGLSSAEAEAPPGVGFPEWDAQAPLPEPDGELAAATWSGSVPTTPAQAAPAGPGEAVQLGTDPAGQDSYQVHAVERGDTFWGLAERYLGSGMRWREIRDHNVGRAVGPGRVLAANEDDLQEGWRLEIPGTETAATAGTPAAEVSTEDSSPSPASAAGDTSTDTSPAADDPASVSDETSAAPAGVVTESPVSVQPGDHFWGLAEQQLEQAWGRPVTAEEIAPYWQELVAANLDGLTSGDPDLVFPGEQLTVLAPPPVPGEGGGTTAAEPPAESAPQPGTETPGDGPSPDTGSPETPGSDASGAETSADVTSPAETEPAGGDETAPPDEAEGERPDVEGETEQQGEGRGEGEVLGSGEEAPSAPEGDQAPAGTEAESEEPGGGGAGVPAVDLADDDLEDSDDDSGFDIPAVVPFGASAALAGLLLLALARRRLSRRRLLRPGVVVEPRPEEDANLERELALGSRDVLDAVAAASRAYGAALAAEPELPGVTGLLVTPGLDVVVHLAEPAEPTVPFERGPASDRWDLYLDELDLDPEFGPGPEPSESVLDTPAVLGRTDEGDWVVVDLESLGALEIDGDPDTAADLVRSIVAELALQPQAERMVDITVVGMNDLSPDVLEQGVVAFDTLDEDLVRRVERVAAETDSMQAHRGAAARAQGMPRDGLFVTVVALGGTIPPDPMLLERLATAATPGGRGVAVIAVGAVGSGATRVLVDESGLAHIPHMGLTVEAVRLAPDSLQRIEQLLSDEPEIYQPAPEGTMPSSWPEWRQSWASDDSSAAVEGDDDRAWMDSWLSSELSSALAGAQAENPDEDMGNPAHTGSPGQPAHDHIQYEADGERAVHEMDTAEVEGLDDMAPATPNLHAVPTPGLESDPPPEPLNVRDEPQWPDPSGQATGAEETGNNIPEYQSPGWEYCVRIFADHVVETPEGRELSFRYGDNPDVPNKNTHRGPELLAYLALSGRAATAEEVKDHMWWDRPVALGTVNKLLYGTRKVLGGADLLSHAQEDPLGRYRLAPTVVTDVQLLSHALDYARTVANRSPSAAVDVLRAHLQAIEAVAFRSGCLGQGLMEWAAAYRVVDAVEQPVVEAALLMSRLSCERGRSGYFDALWAIDQGLRACPYNEALVRMAMEIEALLGNTDAVNHRYLTLATRLARDELEPEPETSELRARLGGTHRLRSAG